MDKLKAMAVFVAIAEAGSLSGAARASGASLPSVVRTLAALEAELGVRLFNRTTRRIALTEEGRSYLDSCRHLLAALAEAESTLHAGAEVPAGLLTVTAPVLFGQLHVAPAVTRFLQRHPQMRCRVLLHDRIVNLLEEGVDVGVRIGALEDSSLVALPVGQLRRVVAASPDYLARLPAPLTHPRQLVQANCLEFTGRPSGWATFHERGRAFDVPLRGNLAFNHIAPIVDACVAGLGVGIFMSYQVAAPLADGRLRCVLEDFEPPPRPVSLVYPHAQRLPARVRAFVAEMRESLTLP